MSAPRRRRVSGPGLCLLVGLALLFAAVEPASAAGPYQFFPVTPCRIVDTRGPVGLTGGPALFANTVRSFPIVNSCGVPNTAKAAALNVTVVGPTDFGDLRVFPSGTPVPLASVINFTTADFAVANGAIIPLSNSGGFDISVQTDMSAGSNGTVHLVLDVTGYFQ